MTKQPNILVFIVDNLGFGELGCYGGGVLRGAPTTRIDQFAAEGIKLLNFAPEAQCTPSRSALMTGRYAIRSGNFALHPRGAEGGLVAWEKTLADILSADGYACSIVGKWHIGYGPGRWPTDHGFESWYGPERSYDEALWSADPYYDPERDLVPFILESTQGGPAEKVDVLTLEARIDIDREFEQRSLEFMRSCVAENKPFFHVYSHSMLHLPTTPREEFRDQVVGDWAGSLLQLDHDFGVILDELDRLGIRDDTIVVFLGENGAEEWTPWRGSSGPWRGSYFTGTEASLRTPCIIRWPGHVAPGASTNEVVHITDIFPTLLNWVASDVPDDRVIDGVDQRALFEGESEESAREGFLFWNSNTLYGVKWGHWKLCFIEQKSMFDPALRLHTPQLFNLLVDPEERENCLVYHTWVTVHTGRLLAEFEKSVEQEPLVPFAAPLDFVPTA